MVDFNVVRQEVGKIKDNYFEDHSTQRVGEYVIEGWNTLMGVFSYLGNKNTYLVGDPGTGKTTYVAVISSVLSGLPFDLFDNLKIQGHPEQTKDTMFARADLGKLAEEGVVWQPGLFLPALNIDEINRLSPGKQAIALEFIRTGMVEHLGKKFREYKEINVDGQTKRVPNKKPLFATVNHNGPGTYPLPGASLDRFDLFLDFRKGNAHREINILNKEDNIERDLVDVIRSDEVLEYLLKKDRGIQEKLTYVQNKMGSKVDSPREYVGFTKELKWDPEAENFLRCFWEETVMSPQYGENRFSDPQDQSSRAKELGCSKVSAGMSPRAWKAIKYYSGMLAGYLDADEVTMDHVMAVIPYTLAHRMEFEAGFKSKYAGQPRLNGDCEQLDLSKRLVKDVKDNFDKVQAKIKLLDNYLSNYGQVDNDTLKDVKQVVNGPEPDYPYFKVVWAAAKEFYESEQSEL